MKTKAIFILIALLGLNVQSCDKYLEEKLVSDVSSDTYYTTGPGMEDAVDATYYYLKFVYSNERAHSLTVFGTDTYTNGADGGFKNFNYYDAGLRSDQSILQEMWQWCYRGVNQANAVIGRIGTLPDKEMTTAQKTLRTAEARFLRALYYFTLTRQWGDVPMPLEETTGPKTDAPKASQADVYEKGMVPDLEFAIANLPASQADWGRATKGAAQHLLGMVLLTRGYTSFAKSDDFQKAEGYFTNVIGGGYALQSDIGKLWDQSNQKNSEIIFSVQNSTNVLLNSGGDGILPGEGNRAHLYYLMEYDTQAGMIRDIANGRPFKRFRPTDYLLDLWAAARPDDNRFDLTYKQVWISNNPGSIPKWSAADVTAGAKNKDGSAAVSGQPKYTVGDTAIFIPGPGNEAKWTAAKKAQTRYVVYTRDQFTEKVFSHIAKFIDPLRPAIQWQEGSRDWFIMRLADTYLSRAEARFKQNNLTGAMADLNVVRARAAKPGRLAQMTLTDPTVINIDFILDERAKELDAEQCRWYDLTRTNTLVARIQKYSPLGKPNIQPYHVRRPYPQTQLDRTVPTGSFKQNCGYDPAIPCN